MHRIDRDGKECGEGNDEDFELIVDAKEKDQGRLGYQQADGYSDCRADDEPGQAAIERRKGESE